MRNRSRTLASAICLRPTAWLLLAPALLSGQHTAQANMPALPTPAVIVQITFTPGTASQWEQAFHEQIVPWLRQARRSADQVTGFHYFESSAGGQRYDFTLVLEVTPAAFVDSLGESPHLHAVLHRLGLRGADEQILAQMASWEATVSVVLSRGYTECNTQGLTRRVAP